MTGNWLEKYGMPGKRDKSLGELIFGMADAFSSELIESRDLSLPIELMRDRGWLEDSTYALLRPLLNIQDLRAAEFLADGRVRYTCAGSLWDDSLRRGDADLVTFDPVKTASWVLRLLQDDRKLEAKLGFRFSGLEELTEAASMIKTGKYPEAFDGLTRLNSPRAVSENGLLFYMKQQGRSFRLYFAPLSSARSAPEVLGSEELGRGLAGELIRQGDDLYFRYNDACAYLHVDAKSGGMEILQNITILGFTDDGALICRDEESGSVCSLKGDALRVLLKDAEEADCRPAKRGIVVSSRGCAFAPFRIDPEGKRGPALPGEASRLFWEHMLNAAGGRGFALSLEENMDRWEVLKAAENSCLSLSGMKKVYSLAFEKKLLGGRKAFPTRDILRLLERLGIDKDKDISAQMFALLHYNFVCERQAEFVKFYDVFTPSFCGLLKKLSRKKDFFARLSSDPAALFKKHVKSSLSSERDIFDIVLAESEDIGNVIMGKDGTIRTEIVPKSRGLVKGGELGPPKDAEPGPEEKAGRVAFDLEKGDYFFAFPSPGPELVLEVSRLFRHNSAMLRVVDSDRPEEKRDEELDLKDLRWLISGDDLFPFDPV